MRPNDRARTIDDAFNGRKATLLLDIANHTRVHCFNWIATTRRSICKCIGALSPSTVQIVSTRVNFPDEVVGGQSVSGDFRSSILSDCSKDRQTWFRTFRHAARIIIAKKKSVRSAFGAYWTRKLDCHWQWKVLCWKATKLELPIDASGNVRSHGFRGSVRRTLREGQAQKHGRRRSPGVKPFLWSTWWIHRQWKFTSMFAVAAWALSVQKRFVAASYSIKNFFSFEKWKMCLGCMDPSKKETIRDSSSSHTRVIMLTPAFPRLPSMILRLTTP